MNHRYLRNPFTLAATQDNIIMMMVVVRFIITLWRSDNTTATNLSIAMPNIEFVPAATISVRNDTYIV